MTQSVTESWSVGRLLGWTREFLTEKGVDEPRLAAELLLSSVLGCKKIELYTRFDLVPASQQIDAFRGLVREAAAHKPIAYLVGHKEFYSLDFDVTPDVLIPRPETELLVEQTIEFGRQRDRKNLTILDVGTGSGCIAVAIAKFLPAARVVATDVSAAALIVAKRNIARHGIADRVALHQADGLSLPAAILPPGGFDVIVSNPPYIPEAQRDKLPANVRNFEPHVALFGGSDGLNLTRRLAAEGDAWIAPAGRCMVEVAAGSHEFAAAIFTDAGWRHVSTIRDGAATPRVVIFEAKR